jgi:NADPH2:quinone reductase
VRAIIAEKAGGPEVLKLVERDKPVAGPGEVLIRHEAVGLNFIDTYHRSGLYPVDFPATLGTEAAGVVESIGQGVTRFKTGDRVAYTGSPGSYTEFRAMPADRVVAVPDGIPLDIVAGSLLKGMTAEYLVRRTFHVKHGDACLVHAAAGGVGSILVQWIKALGGTVIGTVGSEAKAEKARAEGADHVILYDREDVAARVKEITNGVGVPVVYDAVGADTFEASLASLAVRGLLVTFGNASGPVPPLSPLRLSSGSFYLTRPTLFGYTITTAELDESAAALFDVILSGKVKIEIGQRFKLEDARLAHEALEGRQTIGSTVLVL